MQHQLSLLVLLSSLLASQVAAQSRSVFHPQPNTWQDQADKDDIHMQIVYGQWERKCNEVTQNETRATTRIIGGDLAQPGMLPYQVGLLLLKFSDNSFQCGGSLISPQFVLTAAHFVDEVISGRVYLGATRYADVQDSAAVFNITHRDITIHPGYLKSYTRNDLALIRLPQQAQLSQRVQTIALAPSFMNQQMLEQQLVTASGWGNLSKAVLAARPAEQKLLHFVNLKVTQQERCVCCYNPGLVNQRRHICAGGTDFKNTCRGDSGGPLVFRWREVNYLVGVNSFASAHGCEIGKPTVFTRVTEYLPWIQKQMQRVGVDKDRGIGGGGGYYDY